MFTLISNSRAMIHVQKAIDGAILFLIDNLSTQEHLDQWIDFTNQERFQEVLTVANHPYSGVKYKVLQWPWDLDICMNVSTSTVVFVCYFCALLASGKLLGFWQHEKLMHLLFIGAKFSFSMLDELVLRAEGVVNCSWYLVELTDWPPSVIRTVVVMQYPVFTMVTLSISHTPKLCWRV